MVMPFMIIVVKHVLQLTLQLIVLPIVMLIAPMTVSKVVTEYGAAKLQMMNVEFVTEMVQKKITIVKEIA